MIILYFRLSRLRNDAHFQFHFYAARFIEEAGAGAGGLDVELMFEVYKAAIAEEDEIFKRVVKSKFTRKIIEADKARDRVYGSIKSIVRVLLKHYDENIREAARCLKIVIDTYGNINKKSYDEQTAAVYNILQEFKGGNAGDVAAIRLTEMVAELEKANNVVRSLIAARLDEASARNPGSMKAARAKTDKAYLAIRERVNAAIVMEGAAKYETFVTKLNLLLDRYKMLITKSKGKNPPVSD